MEREAQLNELRRLVQEGIDDLEAGRIVEWNPESFKAEMEKHIDAARQRKMKRVGQV